jgi:DNA-binding response OmpR family regulator
VTTLFVIEKNKTVLQGAVAALMGDYAIRVFGSLAALKCLAKVPGQAVPDIVLVDVDDTSEPIAKVTALLRNILPQTSIILLCASQIKEDESYLCAISESCPVYYYKKPFDSLSLSKFVGWVKRNSGRKSNTLRLGDFIFDFDRLKCRVLQEDLAVDLPLKEAQILKLMMERMGECISRSDIQRVLWPNIKLSSRTLDSHISRLRKRLKPMQITINNKYGDGYILEIS